MVEQGRLARFYQCNIVDDFGGMREEIGNPGSALPVLGESAAGAEELGAVAGSHESEAFALDQGSGYGLSVEFDELWLVIEKFQLAWASSHEKVDDVFGAGRVMENFARCERGFGRRQLAWAEHRGEGDAP